MHARIVMVGLLLSLFGLGHPIKSIAQPPQTPAKDPAGDVKSVLGERQRLVERKMSELEARFAAIAEQLREREPERANRLVAAYQRAKETLLTERMARISQLIDQGQTGEALVLLDQVILSLDELVKMLVDTRGNQLDRQQEIKMLEEWQKEIRQIQAEQQKESRETENVSQKDAALQRLDAQIKELENLIGRQKDLREKTQGAAGSGLRALDKIADEQFEVRKQTEKLWRDVAGQLPGEAEKRADINAGAEQPNQGKPADQNAPQKTGDGKSSSGDAQPGKQRSGDNPNPPNPTGNPSAENPVVSPAPGQKPLQQAEQAQRRAEEKLASGKSLDAERQQDQAIKSMEEAKSELEKEKRRIASLPPEALKQIAQNQKRLRDKSREIAQKMRDAPKPKPNPDQESAGNNQPQQPGQQSMNEAGESMQKATNDLNQDNPEDAGKNQKEAEKNLQKALDEIEERLSQLREETREEKLARLESRFREMLDRQKVASTMTIELDDRRNSFGKFEQRDRLVLIRLATEETEINEIGQQAYDLLLEDGTSVVFPEIVYHLKNDLLRVSQLLASEKTDQLTQMIQRDIESNLEELLDALKKAKKKGGGGGGGGGSSKQPLLEKSAELKMLRAAQLRINRRTKQIDTLQAERGADADLAREAENLSQLQAQLLEMAERIMAADDDQ